MSLPNNNYYLAPPPFPYSPSSPHHMDELRGWASEVVQQGRNYLRMQPAYRFIQEGLDIVNGDYDRVQFNNLSNAQTASTLRAIKELIASQTNLRVIPAFSTEHKDYYNTSLLLNKMYMAWQSMTFADRSIRKVWQFASVCGTGYAGIRWDTDYWYEGKGDIVLDAYGPDSVIPIGLPHSHDIQKAYLVALCIPTPIHEVLDKYPMAAPLLKPHLGPTIQGKGGIMQRGVELATAALRFVVTGSVREQDTITWPSVDVYYLYIDDKSINDGLESIAMGEPGTTWEYTVPYLGQRILAGMDSSGNPLFRDATKKDCRLYPNRRLIKFAGSNGMVDVCLNPNPQDQVSPYTHRKVPLVQFRADDWPWGFLGFPLTKSTAPLERSMGNVLRGYIDATNVSLNPPTQYDRNTMSEAAAQAINTRIPGMRAPFDGMMGGGKDSFKPLLGADYLRPQQGALDFMRQCESWIKEWIGSGDAAALARARQLPSGDSTERLLEAMGPLIKDQSRNMELSVTQVGEMWKSCAFQWYGAPRRFELVGLPGVTDEDIDYDPGNLVPAEIDGLPTPASWSDRAQRHVRLFTFKVHPYSIHEMNSMSRRLFFLQLFRGGFPIDPWTLAEMMDIHNFGPKPMIPDATVEGGQREAATVIELWLAWKQMMAKISAAEAAGQAQAQGGEGGAGGSGGGPRPSGGQRGRPPTAQQPPSLAQKGDGRSIVRESRK